MRLPFRSRVLRNLLRRARARVRPVRRGRGTRVELGIAVGADRIVAVEIRRTLRGLRPGRVVTHPLMPGASEGEEQAPLSAAVARILAAWGAESATASVALLRPRAAVKRLDLPPVRRATLRLLMERGARRHFLVGRDPCVADAARVGGTRAWPRGGLAPTVAVCAPRRWLDGVERALEGARIRTRLVTSGSLALVAAVHALRPELRRGGGVIAVLSDAWREGIAVRRGAPRAFEPWSGADRAEVDERVARLASDAFPDDPSRARVFVLARSNGDASSVAEDAVVSNLRDPEAWAPDALTAFGAALVSEDAPALHTPALARAVRARSRRRLAVLSAAAAVLCLGTAVVHLWGLHRELAAVASQRLALAHDVERAVTLRRAAEGVGARLQSLADVEAGAPRWTRVLATLAGALPDSAYLLSMRADGPQVVLSGEAASVPAIVPALETVPFFRDVSLSGVRADAAGGGERFEVSLTLAGADHVHAGGGP